ncbi:C39 family peptidase [Streptococcus rifensis]
MSRKLLKTLALGVGLLGVVLLAACGGTTKQRTQNKAAEQKVETSTAKNQEKHSKALKTTESQTSVSSSEQVSSQSSSVTHPQEVSQSESKPSVLVPVEEDKSHRQERVSENSPLTEGQKHMLQVTPQVQRAWNLCAPTSVSMILSYRGVSVSQEELAIEMGTDESFGTHNANAIRALNKHLFGYEAPASDQAGYRLAAVTTADPQSEEMRLFKERLKQNIADGYPMYYTFDNARIYSNSSGEHNVTGIGYQLTADGSDIAYIYYLDPSYHQQDPLYGGLKKITPQELFHAMLTCVEPNYAW